MAATTMVPPVETAGEAVADPPVAATAADGGFLPVLVQKARANSSPL